LSFKRHGSRRLGIMRYGCYANAFRFNSHLADYPFVGFLYFFKVYVLHLGVSVRT